MMKTYMHMVLFLFAACINNVTYAGVNSDSCNKQITNLLETQINCKITLTPGDEEKASIISQTNNAITNYICDLPIKAPKSDIYGKWIKDNSFTLPTLNVGCYLYDETGSENNRMLVTAVFSPSCVRDNKDKPWGCSINMENVTGLGVIGTILKNAVNKDQNIKDGMRSFMERLESAK